MLNIPLSYLNVSGNSELCDQVTSAPVTQTEMLCTFLIAELPRREAFPPYSAQQWHPVAKCPHEHFGKQLLFQVATHWIS